MSILLRFSALLLYAPTAFGQVRINEILFVPNPESEDPRRNHQWVELFNAGPDPVNLNGYVISGRDGKDGPTARTLPPVDLPGQGYLVIHFASGETSEAEIYTQDSGPLLNEESDEVALYSPDAIVDFMAWASNTVLYEPGAAHNNAVDAGIWTRGARLNRDRIAFTAGDRFGFVKRGESIGRSPASSDTNHPLDFYSGGGFGSFSGQTPGRKNSDPLPIHVPAAEGAAPAVAVKGPRRAEPLAEREWTVFLYMMGDDPTLIQALVENITEIAAAGGSNDRVNFIVLFDWATFHIYQPFGLDRTVIELTGNGTLFGRIRGLTPDGKPIVEGPEIHDANIDEVNSASGRTFHEFLARANTLYPAKKRAVIIGSHGDGWKGLGADITARGEREFDRLFINELKGLSVDLVVLDACLMASVEVATALLGSKYLVASEDTISRDGIAYGRLASALTENYEETPEQIARRMLSQFLLRYSEGERARLEGTRQLSVIDLSQVRDLLPHVDAWSKWLTTTTRLFNKIEVRSDNVQILIRDRARAAQRFTDNNFVDLRDLAQKFKDESGIPSCGYDRGEAMLAQLAKVVLQQSEDPKLPGAYGIHIHFPLYRVWPERQKPGEIFLTPRPEAYDFPSTREGLDVANSGDLPYGVYGPNRKPLPIASRDQEREYESFNAPQEWPSRLAIVDFTEATGWDEFLDAYYHPVAAARIVEAYSPGRAQRLGPFLINRGECVNPYHGVTVPVGWTVVLEADGSSDADKDPELGENILPRHYAWDKNPELDCAGDCVHPTNPDGLVDPLDVANDNYDEDRRRDDSKIDDVDSRSPLTDYVCEKPGLFIMHLYVVDDSHLAPFHNSVPSGIYLRYQSSDHYATIQCSENGTRFGTTQITPYIQDGDKVGLGLGVFPQSGGAIPNHPVQVTPGTRVRNFEANGVAVPPGATETIPSNNRGELRMQFIVGDPETKSAAKLADDPAGIGTVTVAATGAQGGAIQFRYVPRIAPLPTEMILTPPPGTLAVGTQYDFVLEARRDGQPLRDAVFTLQSLPGGIEFVSVGTLYNGNRSVQIRTAANGRSFVRFRPTAPGPIEIDVYAGQLYRQVILNATGPDQPATYIDVSRVPQLVRLNQVATAAIGVFSRLRPLPNTQVTIEVVGGEAFDPEGAPVRQATLITDAQGIAQWRFQMRVHNPLRATIGVPSASLTTTVWVNAEQ